MRHIFSPIRFIIFLLFPLYVFACPSTLTDEQLKLLGLNKPIRNEYNVEFKLKDKEILQIPRSRFEHVPLLNRLKPEVHLVERVMKRDKLLDCIYIFGKLAKTEATFTISEMPSKNTPNSPTGLK